jgi:type III pantothenate kinase
VTWLFDLGNTRLKWARFDDGGLREHGALAHGEPGFEHALDACLAELPRAERALLASVAGEDLAARVAALAARHGVPCERVHTQSEFAGLRIAYAEPARLGVDRFLALLGAHRRGPGPWLIVGVGTALTVDLLADGEHLGGLIAPSPALMREMLASRVPALDVAGGERVDFARCTEDALAGGTVGAALGLIERSHARASECLGTTPALLIAGGGGDSLLAALRVPAEAAPDLVLEGLAVRAAVTG